MPTENELPEPLKPLARRQALELNNKHYHHGINDLISVLEEHIGSAQTRPAAKSAKTTAQPPLPELPALNFWKDPQKRKQLIRPLFVIGSLAIAFLSGHWLLILALVTLIGTLFYWQRKTPLQVPRLLLHNAGLVVLAGFAILALTPFGDRQSLSSDMQTDTTRSGQNMHDFIPEKADPEQCKTACLSKAECRSWVYAHPSEDYPDSRCWLKSGIPEAKKDTCCISGIAPALAGVQLRALPAKDSPAFNKNRDVRFQILHTKADKDGKRKTVDSSDHNPQPLFPLFAGDYIVVTTRGNARIETPITIEPEQVLEQEVILDIGNLELKAKASDNTPPFTHNRDVSFNVYQTKTDIDGHREKVTGSDHYSQPQFHLAQGSYLVTAKRGNAEQQAVIDIQAGKTTQHTFVLNTGNLRLSAQASNDSPVFSENSSVAFIIYENKKDLDGRRKRIDSSNRNPNPQFRLAAGEYWVTAKANGKTVSRVVTLPAGQSIDEHFVLDAHEEQ